MTLPPPNVLCKLTVRHARKFVVRGYRLAPDGGGVVLFLESSGLKRTWHFRRENVVGWEAVRVHRKGAK